MNFFSSLSTIAVLSFLLSFELFITCPRHQSSVLGFRFVILLFVQKVVVDPRVEHAELTMKTNVIGTLNVIHCLLPLLRPHGR